MAATDLKKGGAKRGRGARSSILLAALALPGVMPRAALAEDAPEQSLIALKYLHYQDWQSGFRRIQVNAPSIRALVPVGTHWSVDGSAVVDDVSGASPRYYTTTSGASRMKDTRKAEDITITNYQSRSAFAVGYSHSSEHDYVSDAASLSARFSSADNNTTFNIGLGGSSDSINPVNKIVVDEHKKTWQLVAGVTQALSARDLAQIQLGYSTGHGYFNDPYKLFDNRPRKRNEETAVLRWNHYFEGPGASLHTSYRYYTDSYQVHAHTLQFDWIQPLPANLTLTPTLRYYTQSAASFYVDPVIGSTPETATAPPIPDGVYSTLDQREAAFGSISGALKVDWVFAKHWSANVFGEYDVQRSAWRLIDTGSPELNSFKALWFEAGLEYRF